MEKVQALHRIVEQTVSNYLLTRIKEVDIPDALILVKEAVSLNYPLLLTQTDLSNIWGKIRANEIATITTVDISTDIYFNLSLEGFEVSQIQKWMIQALSSLKNSNSVIDNTIADRMPDNKEFEKLISGNFWLVTMFLIAPVGMRLIDKFEVRNGDDGESK